MFGLSDNTIESLRNIFSKYESVKKVIIYGSRAKVKYRKSSDIDLCLFGKGLNPDILFAIEEKIDELLLPYLFDIAIFDHIDNDDLIDHIKSVLHKLQKLKEGEIYYKKKEKPHPTNSTFAFFS